MEITFSLFFILFWVLLWLTPIILVAKSKKTSGNEKIAWILILIFVSWFAWILYLLLAPLKSAKPNN